MMMTQTHDVIVVGARCAGSPTAMLLARRGYRVLLVDRATFPSDTVSTHIVHPLAVAAVARWGILDRLVATGCPPIHTYVFDFGPFRIAGAPGTADFPVAYCPRRTILDAILVAAAANAGAEVREGFTVEDVLVEDGRVVGVRGRAPGGPTVTERARVVVGADGRHSRIADAVGAVQYREKPPLLCGYYTYWRDLPSEGTFATYIRERRGFGVAPTHDGLTLVIAGWPREEFEKNKADVEGSYLATLALAPEFAEKVRGAKREARFVGASVPNYFRKPFGPGWALVGDAGYNKDPITAQGILDAFLDAERCARSLDESFRGVRPFEEAMTEYQRERDVHALPMYEFTTQVARLKPPTPEMQQLFRALAANPRAADEFMKMNAGTISPAEFFAPEHVRAIVEGTRAAS